MTDNENKMQFEEVQNHDKITVEKICSDDKYAYYFFHTRCRPLLSKIIWTIFNSHADYEELVNSLYEYLKAPGRDGVMWHRLRTFDYRTSLFDWIKVVAVRLFYTPSGDKFKIPEHLIENGVAEDIISCLSKSLHRKYLWLRYINKSSDTDILQKLQIQQKNILPLSRSAIKSLRNIVHSRFPEYYDSLFKSNKVVFTDVDSHPELETPVDTIGDKDTALDVYKYLDAMPNKRYKYVIQSLFLQDRDPEELAIELNTPVSNIYNIKTRAIDQLRDIAINFRDIPNFENYIKLISDDIKREILHSIFVKNKSYEDVCESLQITEVKFKKLKKEAIKEIKNIIFKK